jgi:hypothetical protein
VFKFGCGWAKLNVVFLCWQVRWQNTSFNFAKGWLSRRFFCLFTLALSVALRLHLPNRKVSAKRTNQAPHYFGVAGLCGILLVDRLCRLFVYMEQSMTFLFAKVWFKRLVFCSALSSWAIIGSGTRRSLLKLSLSVFVSLKFIVFFLLQIYLPLRP